MKTGVALVAHGSVDSLDDLPELLANIRRGRPAPPELLAEVRRRYEAIGGSSPLNAINRQLAEALEARLGLPVRVANRLSCPYPKESLEELAALGVTRVVALSLAQHSAKIYGDAVRAAAREVPQIAEVVSADNWGRSPALTHAFADAIAAVAGRGARALVTTAHSLPLSVIEAGDPYEAELRASAADVVAELERRGIRFSEHVVAYQSQAMTSAPGGERIQWLGPDLKAALEGLAARGAKEVGLAPIGFLADNVEILYDLDVEAKGWADNLGMVLYRSASLNAGGAMVTALAELCRALV